MIVCLRSPSPVPHVLVTRAWYFTAKVLSGTSFISALFFVKHARFISLNRFSSQHAWENHWFGHERHWMQCNRPDYWHRTYGTIFRELESSGHSYWKLPAGFILPDASMAALDTSDISADRIKMQCYRLHIRELQKHKASPQWWNACGKEIKRDISNKKVLSTSSISSGGTWTKPARVKRQTLTPSVQVYDRYAHIKITFSFFIPGWNLVSYFRCWA